MAEYLRQEMAKGMGNGQSLAYYRMRNYQNWDMDDVADYLVRNAGVKRGEVLGMAALLSEAIRDILAMGNTVTVDGLGTFRVSLGMVDGKEVEGLDEEDEERRNARSVRVRGVRFRPDRKLVKGLNGIIHLHRCEDQGVTQPEGTAEERQARALALIDEQGSLTVLDYMKLTGLNRNAATRELRHWREQDGSPVTVKGRAPHRVYVRR